MAQGAPAGGSITAPLASDGGGEVAAPPKAGSAQPPAQPSADVPSGSRSGLIGAIKQWIDNASVRPQGDPLEKAKQAIDDLSEKAKRASDKAIRATQESAEKLSTLPNAGTVSGRELCVAAPNGAPDCDAAASRLCQAKGFKSGKSADFVSSEKCPAQVWLSGGKDKTSCTTETHVTRAVCQ